MMRTAQARHDMSLTYRIVMALATPIVRWWGRLTVIGADVVPGAGPVLLIPNHDSAWDPVVIGVATRQRQLRALAKSSLWNSRPLAWVLNGMGQIPIERGRADAAALQAAVEALHAGHAVGVFAEGTVSRGRPLRAQSGAGRLALAAPEVTVVCVAVTGAVDIVRFPRRPRIRVEFFEPTAGQPRPNETAIALSRRTIADVRSRAPYVVPGRAKKAAEYARLAAEHDAGSAAS